MILDKHHRNSDGDIVTSYGTYSISVDQGSKQKTSTKSKGTFILYVSAGAALMGAMGLGMVLGYTAPAIPMMKQPSATGVPLSDDDASWFESLMALGGLVGGLLAGACTDKLGRRSVLVLCGVPFLVGWMLITYGTLTLLLHIGRFLTGVCCGLICGTVPTYVIEISVPEIRGFLGAFFQVGLAMGILVTTIAGTYVSWRWLAVICSVPSILMMIGMATVAPETPEWLLAKGKHKESIDAATSLYGKGRSMNYQMIAIAEGVQENTNLRLRDFKERSLYLPAIYSLILVFVQQFCGINPVSFNTVDIFADTGIKMDPHVATMIVNASQLSANLLSTVIMDRLGRRFLLLLSGIGMGISLAGFGSYYYLLGICGTDFKESYNWIPLASLVVFVIMFALGFGPVPWLLMSELTPQKARGFITGLGTSFHWTFGFVVTKIFDYMLSTLGSAGTYWTYSIISIVGGLFGWFFIPETKGRSLAEIEKCFKKDRASNRSLDKVAIIEDMAVQN